MNFVNRWHFAAHKNEVKCNENEVILRTNNRDRREVEERVSEGAIYIEREKEKEKDAYGNGWTQMKVKPMRKRLNEK